MGPTTSLRPQYFLSRPNGTLTALVAVDELPSSFVIDGVPHVLGQGDTAGMTSLGTVASRGQVYSVQAIHKENDEIPSESTKNLTKTGIPSANASQKTTSTGSKESVEDSKAPEPPKKIYCAYWVRTGQCDFLQQGCKYKHEVNPTILNKFGMREIPKWYREKYGASSMKNGYNGNQKSEEKKLSNSASRNNGSADAGTASSRRVEQLHKWRHFAEKESGAAPPTTQGNVSKGPTTAVVGSKDLLTQDLLPSYTALNPAHSSTESVSRPRSATHQSAHAKSSQTTTQGQAKPSAPATPQKGQERPLTQGTTGSLNSSSNAAGSNGTGSIVSPTQHQARRQRSRRSVQTHVPSESPESSDSTHISGTTNNTGHIISNGSPNCKTPGVALPRLNIPSSRIIEKISSPDSSSHKRTRSILTREKSAADADKKAKSNPAKSGTSEKDEDSESAKSSPATPDETKPVAKGLKPGAATDVFGLGIYDN